MTVMTVPEVTKDTSHKPQAASHPDSGSVSDAELRIMVRHAMALQIARLLQPQVERQNAFLNEFTDRLNKDLNRALNPDTRP